MRVLIDRAARHLATTALAAALLIGAGAYALLHPASAEQPRHTVITLDGWPSDGASAVVWLENGSQVVVQLGVPTTLDGAVQAAVLTRSASAPGSWAQCSIVVNGDTVSGARTDRPESPASCSWPE